MPPTIVKLVTCPTLRASTLNEKKKTIAINTVLLAYTFTKLGDNFTNNDRDVYSLTSQTRREIYYSPFSKHAERAKNVKNVTRIRFCFSTSGLSVVACESPCELKIEDSRPVTLQKQIDCSYDDNSTSSSMINAVVGGIDPACKYLYSLLLHCKKYPYIHGYFLRRVFHLLTEPVPSASVNRRNNEARGPR